MLEKWILKVFPGESRPLGASAIGNRINFSLISPSKHATLILFEVGDSPPLTTIALDLKVNKTVNIWHIAVEGLPADFDYSWKIDGKVVCDPYAKAIASPKVWGGKSSKRDCFTRARYLSPRAFDWQNVKKPARPADELVIYEMHIRGFTQDRSSKTKMHGSYLGVVEKISHLLELGINAVELLPIYEFNEESYQQSDPLTGNRLCDYWGYNPLQFFCPMKRYASGKEIDSFLIEFKTMVRELHRAGIEVILDVVYNHTGEGNDLGPVLSFKGIDRSNYYLHDAQGHFKNYSGTGNTFACNREPGLSLVLDSMRYFVEELQVDGFRFDLASILTRGDHGEPLDPPPILIKMAEDPILKETKLIMEPWDAGGLYQVGVFPKWGPYLEWNGKYRDIARRFLKGTDGQVGAFATAISGSQDLYGSYPMLTSHSINFITCHDGFSLCDLTSYMEKHNERNGEENRDGNNDNESWNCGAEGITDDPAILALRERQMRNYTLALLLSLGIPILLMGDEYGQSHAGNNNTWCQDNHLNWFDWKELEKKKGLFRFFQKTIQLRKTHPELRRKEFLDPASIVWHGMLPKKPDWSDTSRLIAFSRMLHENAEIFVAFHAHYNETILRLPEAENGKPWKRLIDTGLPTPDDFANELELMEIQDTYRLEPYSAIVLIAGNLLSS